MEQRIIVGHFGHSYGIKGWIKIHSSTSPASNILKYLPWQVQHQGIWRPAEVTASKQQGKDIIVKLAGCDNPETAKTFTGNPIAINTQQLPALPAGEYYWKDLIGLRVVNQEGVDFGVIDSLLETGSNDVLVVKGDRQRLLPYTDEVVKDINLTDQKMIVNWDADF